MSFEVFWELLSTDDCMLWQMPELVWKIPAYLARYPTRPFF